jgi:hypothetical protein
LAKIDDYLNFRIEPMHVARFVVHCVCDKSDPIEAE